jgi:hypothetical protein
MAELNYQNPTDARREIAGDWRLRLFGPSRDQVWQQLAREINARHEPRDWFKPGRVVAGVGPWEITLDVLQQENHDLTRLRAPFANPAGFRFRIYRATVFSDLGKMLGMQDIVIGDAAFDQAFIIQGNDDRYVRALLMDPQLRAMIAAQPKIMLEVKDDDGWFGTSFPAGTDELKFQCLGTIKDLDRLRSLFDLFAATLTRLCEIGTATGESPRVTL